MNITMSNLREKVTITLVTIDCCSCGVTFAVPMGFEAQRRRDGVWFYCPAGHQQHFTEEQSKFERERDARVQAEKNAQYWRNYSQRTEQDLGSERKAHSTTKGQLTKARKLVQGGVCPVEGCHRHFVNLERHMASKHPEAAA